METNALKIYDTSYGNIDVQIDYQADTIWLNKQELAVGYRINSKKTTQFRIWATGMSISIPHSAVSVNASYSAGYNNSTEYRNKLITLLKQRISLAQKVVYE